MNEQTTKVRGSRPVESLEYHELLSEALVETMERVPLMFSGNERFAQLHREIEDRLNGKILCDGCREKARNAAQEPS